MNDNARQENSEIHTDFLNPELLQKFRDAINSSVIFTKSEKHKNRYNLTCTVLDRLDSAIKVLNTFQKVPGTEESVVIFFVYACILRDGIDKLYENVFSKKPPCINDKTLFCNAIDSDGKTCPNTNCPTDDVFFEYLRSLVFAHPFETKYRKNRVFMRGSEVHYSPEIIPCRYDYPNLSTTDQLGVRVFSSETYLHKDIFLSFINLKQYIKKRYEYLSELTEWANNEVLYQNLEWESDKIERTDDDIQTLKNAKSVLEKRYINPYEIDELINCLSCEISIESNSFYVNIFRDLIRSLIPDICNCIDNLDINQLDKVISKTYVYPENVEQALHYQLEKIFSYLTENEIKFEPGSDVEWALIQAREFSKGFAKKWVIIKPYEMSYVEIKLLVRTACYLEWSEHK